MKILFKNAYLLLRDENGKYEAKKGLYLLVENDLISYIGKDKPTDFDVEYNMKDKLIMPGLINCHGHSAMTLFRGVGTGLKLQDWLQSIFPLEDKLTPEQTLVANRLACLEMISSGTTSFDDMYMFSYTTMKAAVEAGLNANISRCVVFNHPEEDPKNNERYNVMMDFMNILETKSNSRIKYELGIDKLDSSLENALLTRQIIPVANLHSEYLINDKFADQMAKDLKPNDLITIHVSETEFEHQECIKRHGVTPIEYFINHNVIKNNNAYVAHCVYCTDHDLELMAKHGVSLVHNPSSNLKLGSGIFQIERAIKKGVNVCLGTDGCGSNNNLNMLEELHLAALLASGSTKDASAVQVDDLLDMVTINGAKALNRPNTGILKEGYKADLIAIDLNNPNMVPYNDIPSSIVYSASSSDITMTMANGKILYKDGKYLTLNKKQIIEDIKSIKLI